MNQRESPTHGSSGFLTDLALFITAIRVKSFIKEIVYITGGEHGILNESSSLNEEASHYILKYSLSFSVDRNH